MRTQPLGTDGWGACTRSGHGGVGVSAHYYRPHSPPARPPVSLSHTAQSRLELRVLFLERVKEMAFPVASPLILGFAPPANYATLHHTTTRMAGPTMRMDDELTRRGALHLLVLGGLAGAAGPAAAFPNAVPEYAEYVDKPKRAGTPPKDLGVLKRSVKGEDPLDDIEFTGLRGCDGKTNCFSTTGDFNLEDRILTGVDTLIRPWTPPADDNAPFKSLVQAIKAYQPGQGFVDGGGFKIVKETDNYIYVQYEALKKGYIDDAEWLLGKDGLVTLRSSSRVGSTDFGVNGKRLNFIADGLRKSGWKIDEITTKSHPDYWGAADDAADQTFDKDRRRGTGLEDKRLERGMGASAPSV